MSFLLLGFVITSMVLYGNTISIIKKIKNDQDIASDMLFGILLAGFMGLLLFIK